MSLAPHAPVLSFGCAVSDRIEALLDGRIAVNGFALDIRLRQPQTLFREVLGDQAYDLAEMSLGSHIANVSAGKTDYVSLPIFLSRAFRHPTSMFAPTRRSSVRLERQDRRRPDASWKAIRGLAPGAGT